MEPVKLLFGGDVAQTGRTSRILSESKLYALWGNSRLLLDEHDYIVCNLETPLVDKVSPIKKVGPTLEGNEGLVNFLKKWGVDAVSLANNHIMDHGAEGLSSTILACDVEGIAHFGAGRNLEEALNSINRIELKGQKISIIGVAESEFSTATAESPGCASMCPIDLHKTITREVSDADHVVIFFHGGVEMYELPRPGLQKICRFMVDLGASAIVGSHSHVSCGYEVYKGSPIFYGMGNLLFDDTGEDMYKGGVADPKWKKGFFVSLKFGDSLVFEVHPFEQSLSRQVGIHLLNGPARENFVNDLKKLNSLIESPGQLHKAWVKFAVNKKSAFAPILKFSNNRIIKKLTRVFIGSKCFPNKIWMLNVLNKIRCESHRERLTTALEELTKK